MVRGEPRPVVRGELSTRRQGAVRAWTRFVEQGAAVGPLVGREILSSWTRSEAAITTEVTQAPLADEDEIEAIWRDSPLQIAVERVGPELRRTAEDGDLVIAVT